MGLLQIQGVAEQIRFMGPTWQWAWEYGIGNRKLCWLHLMRAGVDATFTLSENEESRLAKGTKVGGALARAIVEGQRTGPVKWCWLELVDRRSVDAFLSLARRKAEWLAERTPPRRSPRPPGGNAAADEIETDWKNAVGLCNRMRGLYFAARSADGGRCCTRASE